MLEIAYKIYRLSNSKFNKGLKMNKVKFIFSQFLYEYNVETNSLKKKVYLTDVSTK